MSHLYSRHVLLVFHDLFTNPANSNVLYHSRVGDTQAIDSHRKTRSVLIVYLTEERRWQVMF